MLRHWEAQGVLALAEVDSWTGQRRYASTQAGRVRAIAALKEVGFGLEAIRDLLDQGLTEARLIDLLRRREDELSERIAADSTASRRCGRACARSRETGARS
jgi:DNA-binding transcriptional MerR regulator